MSGSDTGAVTPDCLSRLAVLETIVDERYRAANKALELAASAVDRRMEAGNQFKEQLKEQAANFITRQEHAILQDIINRLATEVHRSVSSDDLAKHVQMQDERDRAVATRLATLTTQVWVGGSGVLVLISVVQIAFEYLSHIHS